MVIPVIPGFISGKFGLRWCVTVGQVVTINCRFIAINLCFADGVGNLLTIFVLRQIGETVLPVIFCGNCLFINFLIILQEVYFNACGTLAVLVIIVVPGLLTINIGRFRRVGVGDVVIIVNGSFVTWHLIFGDGVDNWLTVFVLW